jgi:hypothetical protein
LVGEALEPLLIVAHAWRREATTASHQEVIPHHVLPWMRIPFISNPF